MFKLRFLFDGITAKDILLALVFLGSVWISIHVIYFIYRKVKQNKKRQADSVD